MFTRIRRSINRFFRKSQTVNNEPLNRVSLVVIILIDIFILFNVFTGLDAIGRWHLSPYEIYPCHSEWVNYRTATPDQTLEDKNYQLIRQALPFEGSSATNFRTTYEQAERDRLGQVSTTCLQYADYKDQVNTPANQQTSKLIDQKQAEINQLNQTNATIRSQYDSTLLEQIAGQSPDRSINNVPAANARRELDQNNRRIETLTQEIVTLKQELIARAESTNLINFLNQESEFQQVKDGYEKASFWYPTIQILFQAIFLLPLIVIALSIHKFAQRKGYGLVALISWHLLVIFLIPLIIKVFQVLQVGALFEIVVDVLTVLFGGLLFLVNYLYIFVIPLIGFGLIKFFQRFVFNPKLQAAKRVQKSQCIRCAKNLRPHDEYCPHCGYFQSIECPNCHSMTYKFLPHCKHCGSPQETLLRDRS